MASSIMENMENEILLNKCPDSNIKGDLQNYKTIKSLSYMVRTNMQKKITGQTENLFGILRKTRRSVEKNLGKIEKKEMLELKRMIKSMMKTSFEIIDILNNQPSRKMAQSFKMSPVDDGFAEKADFCTNVNKAGFVDTVSNFPCQVKTEKVEIKEERMDEEEVEKQVEEGKDEKQVEKQEEEKKVQELIKEEEVEKQIEEEEFEDKMDEGNSDDDQRPTCFQNESNTGFEDKINKKLSYLAPESKLKVPAEIMGNNDRRFSLDQRVECIRLINSEQSISYQHFYHYYYNYYSNHYQNLYENYQAINHQQTYDPRLWPQQQPYPGYYCNTTY